MTLHKFAATRRSALSLRGLAGIGETLLPKNAGRMQTRSAIQPDASLHNWCVVTIRGSV